MKQHPGYHSGLGVQLFVAYATAAVLVLGWRLVQWTIGLFY